MDTAGLARVGAFLEATVTIPAGATLRLAALIQFTVPENGIGLFTAGWGEVELIWAAYGAAQVKVVTVRDGKVVAVADSPAG